MKFKIHSILGSLIIVAIISFFSLPAWGTDVVGIIDKDTTWDLAGSPYNILENVQIDTGVKLTIEPGVTVYGNNYWVEVWGTLEAMGSQSEYIELNRFRTETKSGGLNALLNIEFAHFSGGMIRPYNGTLLLNNSILQDMETALIYPISDCYIEKNIFLKSGGIRAFFVDETTMYIRNNIFIDTGIKSDRVYGGQAERMLVEHNSFLSTDRWAVRLGTDGAAAMTAINNYWNTADTEVIESTMIFDRNDDLNVANFIEYEPILPAPHQDTPSLAFVLANFTANRTSGDYPLTINFTDQSFGTIDTWNWDFGDNTGSALPNPNHTYTDAGTYTVSLTITGANGTDTKTRTNHITVYEPPEPPPPPPDTDGDGVIDPEDNCINEWNPEQTDSDMDHIGDACDIDQMQLQIDEMSSEVDSLVEQNQTLQTQMTNLLEAYNSMDQRIQDLEEGYSDHSHSYLTGKGSGHNNMRAVSGPDIYPASPEPIPKKK